MFHRSALAADQELFRWYAFDVDTLDVTLVLEGAVDQDGRRHRHTHLVNLIGSSVRVSVYTLLEDFDVRLAAQHEGYVFFGQS